MGPTHPQNTALTSSVSMNANNVQTVAYRSRTDINFISLSVTLCVCIPFLLFWLFTTLSRQINFLADSWLNCRTAQGYFDMLLR